MRYGIDRLCQIVFQKSVTYQALTPIQKLKLLSDYYSKSLSSASSAHAPAVEAVQPKNSRIPANSARTRRLNSSASKKLADDDVEVLMLRHCRSADERKGSKSGRKLMSVWHLFSIPNRFRSAGFLSRQFLSFSSTKTSSNTWNSPEIDDKLTVCPSMNGSNGVTKTNGRNSRRLVENSVR